MARMNLSDFAEHIGKELFVIRRIKENSKWTCDFPDTVLKRKRKRGFIPGPEGAGDSPEAAMSDYARKIRGKTLVFYYWNTNKQEFLAPKNLTA